MTRLQEGITLADPMIVVMRDGAPENAIESVVSYLISSGFDVHRSSGRDRCIIGVVGQVTGKEAAVVREYPGVAKVVRVTEPYQLASRRFRDRPTVVSGPWGRIGGGDGPWIAVEAVGPATDMPYFAAGRPFDAGVYRHRNPPETVGALVCLPLHPTATSPRFPVAFVERSPSWGAHAWLDAAEAQLARREGDVVLLEAGGEYPTGARTLEVAAIARVQQRSHLPIVVDVPTIAQRAKYVPAVACAAAGAGVDGFILRVWTGPEEDVPTEPATLTMTRATQLAEQIRDICAVVGRQR